METSQIYVGIDVSKLCFDVAIPSSKGYAHHQFSNDEKGFKSFLKTLSVLERCQIVMEATGPYYLRLACYLHQAQLAVSVINPLVIRRFCQMRMSRAKTDKKDAIMISEYGKTEQPLLWTPEPDYVLALRQMQAAVELLDQSRTDIIRQLEAFNQNPFLCKDVMRAHHASLRHLEKQIATLNTKMEELITQHDGALYQNIQSIPGIGKKTALTLIVISAGFKKFSNAKQLCSYVGLSPRIYQSGSSVKGKTRITKMGMSRVRTMLYLCAWSAKRYNETCKLMYDRLVAAGKPKKVALIAVANKLLKQSFAIGTRNETFIPNYSKKICF
ncbi:MAG: transposase [Chitinophagaceae bacterium]|nr:transposase [Chitinophagaceae bacterium]